MQPNSVILMLVNLHLLLGYSLEFPRHIQTLVDTPEEFKAITKDSTPALEVSIISQEANQSHQSHIVTVKLDNFSVKLNIHRNGNQISGSRQVDRPFKITNAHKNLLDNLANELYQLSPGNNEQVNGNRNATPSKHIQLAANMVRSFGSRINTQVGR